jgi:hypothetical protein
MLSFKKTVKKCRYMTVVWRKPVIEFVYLRTTELDPVAVASTLNSSTLMGVLNLCNFENVVETLLLY